MTSLVALSHTWVGLHSDMHLGSTPARLFIIGRCLVCTHSFCHRLCVRCAATATEPHNIQRLLVDQLLHTLVVS